MFCNIRGKRQFPVSALFYTGDMGYIHDEDASEDFEETDSSGRYGRYSNVLGRGAFKTVYKAFDTFEGIEVAWNQVKVQDIIHNTDDIDRLYAEVHLLKRLKHKNIIKFYHSWIDPETQNLNFVTELFTSGTLRQYRMKHRRVDIRAIKNWSRQVLRGLLYLHSLDPPVIHRDLKCDNIFINGNQGEVKIGDLGLAAILRKAYAACSVIGTPEFMAPELYEEEYTVLVDIYAFGMCVLEMATCEYPYSECSNAAQIYRKVSLGKPPAALNKVKDPDLRNFVEKCIAPVSRRPHARELLMDPFLMNDKDSDSIDGVPSPLFENTSFDSEQRLQTSLERELLKPLRSVQNMHRSDSDSVLSVKMSKKSSGKGFGTPDTSGSPIVPCKSSLLSHTIEDNGGKKLDFQVKGKMREKDTVHLRIRIAYSEGEVRVIHFPFDVKKDTAISVANEMITELNLTDHGVIRMAEIIDAAILVMLPEWRPSSYIDKSCNGIEEDHARPLDCKSTSETQNCGITDCKTLTPYPEGVMTPYSGSRDRNCYNKSISDTTDSFTGSLEELRSVNVTLEGDIKCSSQIFHIGMTSLVSFQNKNDFAVQELSSLTLQCINSAAQT